jgi:hypothetical protein
MGLYATRVNRFKPRDYVYLYIANNNNYIGCDCETCHFAFVKGVTIWCVIVGGPWCLDMEGSCA